MALSRRVLDSKLLQLGHFFHCLGTEVRMVMASSQEGGLAGCCELSQYSQVKESQRGSAVIVDSLAILFVF